MTHWTDLRLRRIHQRLEALEAALAQREEPVEPMDAHTTTLRNLLECCLSWEPDACVLGNVTARQAVAALRAALAEPEQEPVAWRTFDGEGGYDYRAYEDNEDYAKQWNARNQRHVGWVEPLYLAPPQRKPLTEEEIMRAFYAAEKTPMSIRHGLSVVEAARIVEKAHGIGEQP